MTNTHQSDTVAQMRACVAASIIIITLYYVLLKIKVLHMERVRKKQWKVAGGLMMCNSWEHKFLKIFQSFYSSLFAFKSY